jgi:hypothetical protein
MTVSAQEQPVFQRDFGRDNCTFTSVGQTPFFPLIPGLVLTLEGEDVDDENELVQIKVQISVLPDTEMVDGVMTRVYEEREWEDDELVEVSRNFMAMCRETGDVWYFGEDVDDYEDGEIVGHGGAWRAGVDGAEPGIIMPGSPIVGARYFQEYAAGSAEDQGEVAGFEDELVVPFGTYENVLKTLDTSPLEPGAVDEKYYARGLGIIKDASAELVGVTMPPCMPGEHTLCLNDGRFEVEVDFTIDGSEESEGFVHQVSNESGEVWFFGPDNVELIIKVLDACALEGFNNYWVFASGLTNVGVTIGVKDTKTNAEQEYGSEPGEPFPTVLDTAAFQTCP